MNKKTAIMFAFCVAIGIMGVVYAAFGTRLTVTTTATGSGGIDIRYTCSCSGTAGLTGGTTPTGTCTPTTEGSATDATMSATLYQPGDSVTCTWTAKNYSSFRVKTSAAMSCSGTLASAFTRSNSTLASGTTLAVNGTTTFSVTIGYASSITSQPGTTDSGTVTCTVPWTQVA